MRWSQSLWRLAGGRYRRPSHSVWSRRSSGAAAASAEARRHGDSDLASRNRIRNFSIIAHIDHGKSTLADRLMQTTNTISKDLLLNKQQLLDDMDLERERGITIKMRAVRMMYQSPRGEYQLNLIDTPGHVDFSYEVSRSLAAVEGALLVIDASQGVQAQTVANVDLAIENDLEILTVLNKIDLPHADPDRALKEVESIIGLDPGDAVLISAKTGFGISNLLEAIVDRFPHPKEPLDLPLRALIFDSYYDVYRGVVVFVRITGGSVRRGDKIRVMSSKAEYFVEDTGIFSPQMRSVQTGLKSGEVGYIIANVKNIADVPVGDTITLSGNQGAKAPLPGYRTAKPMVFSGLFPHNGDDFDKLRDAISKLKLNDASLVYQPDSNSALGQGFRCGFLGLLHMDIVKERLEREYSLSLLCTTPSVTYRVTDRKGLVSEVTNPCDIPHDASSIEEPFVRVDILAPSEYLGALMEVFRNRRGTLDKMKHLSSDRVNLSIDMPLIEVVTNLHDVVKSTTRGYASMDYHYLSLRKQPLVRMDFTVAGSEIEALSTVVPRDDVHKKGKQFCRKLKELIPRHQFKVVIQAKVGSKVVASEHLDPFRKDVTAKCYGGDVTRKKKLLEKQKEGKKKMKMFGRVDVPEETFRSLVNVTR